jgi:membrane associated rhomboid family serine protease
VNADPAGMDDKERLQVARTARWAAVVWLIASLGVLIWSFMRDHDRVAWIAHIFGCISLMTLGLAGLQIFKRKPDRFCAAVAVVLMAIVLVSDFQALLH